MLEENDGWAAFITTPRGRNHAKAMLDMAKGNPRWFAEVSSIHDTHALTQAQIDESLTEYVALYGEDIGRAQFEQEYSVRSTPRSWARSTPARWPQLRTEGRIKVDRAAGRQAGAHGMGHRRPGRYVDLVVSGHRRAGPSSSTATRPRALASITMPMSAIASPGARRRLRAA
jgi:hypothetical protein